MTEENNNATIFYDKLMEFEKEKEKDITNEMFHYISSNGFPRLAIGVLGFKYLSPSILLRNMTPEHENAILTQMIEITPSIVELIVAPLFTLNGTCNSCITKHLNKYVINCRVVNYKLDREKANHFIFPEGVNYFESKNVFLTFKDTLTEVEKEKVFKSKDGETGQVRGIEDIRVLSHKDELYYVGTIFDDNKLVMTYGKYDENVAEIERNPIVSPYQRNQEKNWAMFMYNEECHFVYRWFPLEIGKVVDGKLDIVYRRYYENVPILKYFKGSSCGVLDEKNNVLWFLVHFHSENEFRQYYHAFVIMDAKTFELKAVSSPFTFEKQRVEFGMGLIVEEDRIIVSYTCFDQDARVAVFSRVNIANLLFNSFGTIL